MERWIEGLIALVKRGGPATVPREVRVDASGAPPCVRALVDALATHATAVDLGELAIRGGSDAIVSLAAAITTGQERGELDDVATIEPAATLLLAYDRGGRSALGLGWSGGRAFAALVEIDDPTPDNLVRTFDTPAALLAQLDHVNRRRPPSQDLEALRVASGLATTVAAPATIAVLSAWTGETPPHPFAAAQAHFAQPGMVFQAGPTPNGVLALARRRANGPPPLPPQLSARAADGTISTIALVETTDVYGLCVVPGRERALVCVGAPGRLVEVDLDTGATRDRLASVGWGCGFVDADHLAVLADGSVCVYRYGEGELGAPVATLPAAVSNVFVGHGCVFGKTKDFQNPAFQILRWADGALVDTGAHSIALKLFALHAAAARDGALLVAGVDFGGKADWLRFSPPG